MSTSVGRRVCLKTLMAVILFQVVVCVVMYVEHSVRVACVMKNSTCFVLMLRWCVMILFHDNSYYQLIVIGV